MSESLESLEGVQAAPVGAVEAPPATPPSPSPLAELDAVRTVAEALQPLKPAVRGRVLAYAQQLVQESDGQVAPPVEPEPRPTVPSTASDRVTEAVELLRREPLTAMQLASHFGFGTSGSGHNILNAIRAQGWEVHSEPGTKKRGVRGNPPMRYSLNGVAP